MSQPLELRNNLCLISFAGTGMHSLLVWNLVVDIAGEKEAEGVWEQGVEENIWT